MEVVWIKVKGNKYSPS
ncbi:hypothetical protein GQ600_22964 [Phytophthora cactorum]|nr:hypothetical protein GQ600_22964 [Phytophthora cactorum]